MSLSLAEQESTLRFESFSATVVWELATLLRKQWAEKYAARPEAGIAFAVELFSGHSLLRMTLGNEDATCSGKWVAINGKLNITKRYHQSSLRFGTEMRAAGRDQSLGLNMPEFLLFGGSFPIFVKNVTTGPIGAFVVSGLHHEEDHQIIIDLLTAYLNNSS